MTTAREYESQRWKALIFGQEDLSWVSNGYVLTFGGFLLLGAATVTVGTSLRAYLSAAAVSADRKQAV